MTEIPTDEGKLYLATVIDLYSRRLLACPTSARPNAARSADAIKIAAAVRGGRENIDGVIFHTDRGSTYTASIFTALCADRLGVVQSMGRVGSCFDTPPQSRSSPPSNTKCSPATTSQPSPGQDRRTGLAPRVLQHQTTTQHSGDDVTGRVREEHR